MRSIMILLLALVATSFSTGVVFAARNDDPYAWRWYEFDERGELRVNLFIFWRSTCPHCPSALAFADDLHKRHPWVKVYKYEVSQHAGNLELYRRMAASLNRSAGQVPALFYCKQMTMGYTSYAQTGKRIEANLVNWHEQLKRQLPPDKADSEAAVLAVERQALAATPESPRVHRALTLSALAHVAQASPSSDAYDGADDSRSVVQPVPDDSPSEPAIQNGEATKLDFPELELPPPLPEEPNSFEVPFFGRLEAGNLSLPTLTLVIAACDAFNPCAFFVLLTLLSLLIHAHSRSRMLLVGGIFVLFSGLFYFLFMAAWLNVFLLAGHLSAITITAGVLAIVVAAINIKDYFLFHRGVSLSIPASAKPGLFARMRKLLEATHLAPMLVGTLALALAANTYELLCTAGFPLVYTRVLTLNELPAGAYYGYLVFYNLVYIVPLAAIVLAFTVTLGRRTLQEHEGRVLKLLAGVMMLLLGGVILLAPDLLHNLLASIGILVAALGITTLIVLFDRLRKRGANRKWPRPERTKPRAGNESSLRPNVAHRRLAKPSDDGSFGLS